MQRPLSMRWRPFYFLRRRLQVFGVAYQIFLLLAVILLGVLALHERHRTVKWKSQQTSTVGTITVPRPTAE